MSRFLTDLLVGNGDRKIERPVSGDRHDLAVEPELVTVEIVRVGRFRFRPIAILEPGRVVRRATDHEDLHGHVNAHAENDAVLGLVEQIGAVVAGPKVRSRLFPREGLVTAPAVEGLVGGLDDGSGEVGVVPLAVEGARVRGLVDKVDGEVGDRHCGGVQ